MRFATRVGVTASKADVAVEATARGAIGDGHQNVAASTARTNDNTRLFTALRLVGTRQIRSARRRAVTALDGSLPNIAKVTEVEPASRHSSSPIRS